MNVLLVEDNSGDALLEEKALAKLDNIQGNITVVERLEQALYPENVDSSLLSLIHPMPLKK